MYNKSIKRDTERGTPTDSIKGNVNWSNSNWSINWL